MLLALLWVDQTLFTKSEGTQTPLQKRKKKVNGREKYEDYSSQAMRSM